MTGKRASQESASTIRREEFRQATAHLPRLTPGRAIGYLGNLLEPENYALVVDGEEDLTGWMDELFGCGCVDCVWRLHLFLSVS
jgi:hypothetical protein